MSTAQASQSSEREHSAVGVGVADVVVDGLVGQAISVTIEVSVVTRIEVLEVVVVISVNRVKSHADSMLRFSLARD